MKYLVIILLLISCTKTSQRTKDCYTVCDVTKNPDLQLVTSADTGATEYFTNRYQAASLIKLEQNHVVTPYEANYNGWTAGEIINMVTLRCLLENVAPKDCNNDWLFNESQGTLVGTDVEFEGLFEFYIYEKGKGNSWKLLHEDYKNRFNPSTRAAYPYWYNTDFCYYYGIGERAVQAQMGDFYDNAFRLPNHDGIYKLELEFNPLEKGCRAVKETNYDNNKKIVKLQISEGQIIIK